MHFLQRNMALHSKIRLNVPISPSIAYFSSSSNKSLGPQFLHKFPSPCLKLVTPLIHIATFPLHKRRKTTNETMKKHHSSNPEIIKHKRLLSEKPWLPAIAIASILVALTLVMAFDSIQLGGPSSFLCSWRRSDDNLYSSTPTQLQAILHYATSRTTPQQSRAEITLSFDVLKSLAPCNFLVFGLGHDSLMWTSLNPHGTTVFLEEDPKWMVDVLKKFPTLDAHLVNYPTQLSEADQLLSEYKDEQYCLPKNTFLKGNTKCKLALSSLPEKVYEKEWDVIMIDAPRGYFNEAPGRMGAIFSAAVMSRARTRPGVTHVYLHDVNRKVEKNFANEFLCSKYLVKAVGRLWHFEIPPSANLNSDSFC